MKRFSLFLSILVLLTSCNPSPDNLAKKYSKQVHSYLEQSLKEVSDSSSAYELAVSLFATSSLYDSLYNHGQMKYELDADAMAAFVNSFTTLDQDSLFCGQWKKMVSKNRSQLKNLPTNTWMINVDNMSPSSIFKVNKGYTEVTPYNYTKSLELSIPTNDIGWFLSARQLFFNYDSQNKLLEIRTVQGKVGHFRKASPDELVMGHFANRYDEMYVTKNSKVVVEEKAILGSPATCITINDVLYLLLNRGRSGACDSFVDAGAMFVSDYVPYIMRRQLLKNANFDFMLDVPDEERNIEEFEDEVNGDDEADEDDNG